MKNSLCAYGCGQSSKFLSKSGKPCCNPVYQRCPEQRRKNSEGNKGPRWVDREHPRGMKGKTPWNKGKTKETDKRLSEASIKQKKFRKENPKIGFCRGTKHSIETKQQISKTMKAIGAGGYRVGSGRGKKGWYKGIFCDSSWELAFVLWCEIKGRKVKRARKRFQYYCKKQWREYLPDFRYKTSSGEWKYLEIKGYVSEQWKAKKAAFPHELILISHKTMSSKILPVVRAVYGKKFIELYEKTIH